MKSSAARQETTINAQLVGVLPGDPPKLNLVIHASGRNGTKRRLTRQILIPDSALFARLKQEASAGDYLRATVVSEYHETGSVTYLTDFSQVPDAEAVAPVPKNGTVSSVSNIVLDDVTQITTQITLSPAGGLKTKIKH